MSDDQEKVLDHDYDGIKEMDNPLPNWWLITFFITIFFGFIYWIHYEYGGGITQWAELEKNMAAVQELQKKSGAMVTDTEDELKKLVGDNEVISLGGEVFQAKCAVCHGATLEGSIGPNLIDETWINGTGTLLEIAGIIRKGVLEKGMPSWEGQLKNDEIRAVTAFIGSKIGQNK